MQKSNNMRTANTLKGIAIMAVLINHYLNLNVIGDSTEFANAWIAIFFFLSGYGLFLSLDNLNNKFNNYRLFYIKRIVRIYPLLWLSWFIQMLVTNGRVSLWVPTGIHGSGHYWFIPAILQCYLVAPVTYLAVRRRPLFTVVTLSIVVLAVNYIIIFNNLFSKANIMLNFFNTRWRTIYFFHIIVFSFGMLFAVKFRWYIATHSKLVHKFFFWILLLIINLLMLELKINFNINTYAKISFHVIPVFLVLLFSVYVLRYSIENSFFEFFGKISYSIYLFHMSLYLGMNNIFSFRKNSIGELLTTLIAFPFFIIILSYIENKADVFSGNLFGLITKRIAKPLEGPRLSSKKSNS